MLLSIPKRPLSPSPHIHSSPSCLHAPPVWHKLRESFYQACRNYLEGVDEFCLNQEYIEFAGAGAWAYKGWNLGKGRGSYGIGTTFVNSLGVEMFFHLFSSRQRVYNAYFYDKCEEILNTPIGLSKV